MGGMTLERDLKQEEPASTSNRRLQRQQLVPLSLEKNPSPAAEKLGPMHQCAQKCSIEADLLDDVGEAVLRE
jgi:hypothetical protein